MKKVYLVLVIMLILSSCKSKVGSINNDEILIVHKGLMISNPNHTEINVIAEPNNNSVINFKNGGFDDDVIIATYKLVKNGETVYDNLNNSQVIGQQNLRGRLSNLDNFNYINGVFHDFTTNVFVNRCEIKLLTPYPAQAGAQQKIFFKMFENHTKPMNEGEGNNTALFSMPNEIELIKQP